MDTDKNGTDEVSDATAQFEAGEAARGPGADREPTEDEEQAAERARDDPAIAGDPDAVAENYRDMAKRGVEEKGEGKID